MQKAARGAVSDYGWRNVLVEWTWELEVEGDGFVLWLDRLREEDVPCH